jgi:acyl-CoA reductase-like NAD-dependent aldehyde dehydrogenase
MEAPEALLDRVSAADGDTEIKDPATGEVIGRHTFGVAADVKAAVGVAAAAQPAWAALTDSERVGYLNRIADNIEAHKEELAYAIVREQGKPISGLGARVVMGGDPDTSQPGFFYPKTLIADIDNDAPLVQEEQFGPALPIIRYTDLEQAVAWANGVDVGLGASVWSADRDKAREIAARLEAGTVWINGHGGIHPMIPFGAAKKSGYGLEFGVDGLKSVAVPQVISG